MRSLRPSLGCGAPVQSRPTGMSGLSRDGGPVCGDRVTRKSEWPPPMAVVEVTWIDSSGAGGWHGVDHWAGEFTNMDLTCRSVGYLFREDDERLMLLMSVAAVGSLADQCIIPKVAVLNVRRLRAAGQGWDSQEDAVGGKPSKGTPADKRLSSNKPPSMKPPPGKGK